MTTFQTLITLLLISVISVQPALAGGQTDFGSIDISPTYQELPVGGIAAFTVSANSSSGGTVFVNIPTGLDLLGDPVCYSGCRVPMVFYGADATTIDLNIDGQIATFGFSLSVNYTVPIGGSLNIGATLVGGPQAIEMSSASILVTEAVPTQPSIPDQTPLPEQQPPTQSPYELGESNVSMSVSPERVISEPGGNWTYFIQPLFLGAGEITFSDHIVKARLPNAVELVAAPICGQWSSKIPESSTCVITAAIEDGATVVTAFLGDSVEALNGVYLPVAVKKRQRSPWPQSKSTWLLLIAPQSWQKLVGRPMC